MTDPGGTVVIGGQRAGYYCNPCYNGKCVEGRAGLTGTCLGNVTVGGKNYACACDCGKKAAKP